MTARRELLARVRAEVPGALHRWLAAEAPHRADPRGLLGFLVVASDCVWEYLGPGDVADQAWGGPILKPATLSNRFLYTGAPRPRSWLVGLRAAAITYGLATGLTAAELAQLLDGTSVAQVNATLTQADPGHRAGPFLRGLAQREHLAWGWRAFVRPLLTSTDPRAWRWPAMVSPTAPHSLARLAARTK